MRAILIDDDPQSLYLLEQKIITLSDINIIGSYKDPSLGKEAVLNETVDVVFLETLIACISGIVLANQFKEKQPELHTVFVTEHKEYALDAYNLNAIDYVLKPIEKQRFAKTIQRLENA